MPLFFSSLARLRHLLALLLLLWLCVTPGVAQSAPAVEQDVEAVQHARLLLDAYQASAESLNDPAFLDLLLRDPNLTRRAFGPLFENWSTEVDPTRKGLAERLVPRLADLILERFSDHIPSLLLTGIDAGNPNALLLLARYNAFLLRESQRLPLASAEVLAKYGPYDDTYDIVDTAADYSPQSFAIQKLYFGKMLRYEIASLVENFPQAFQEQDTLSIAIKQMNEASKKAGLDQNFDALDTPNDGTALFTKILVKIEIGLLDAAKELLEQEAPPSDVFSLYSAGLYLAGARVAYSQSRLPMLKEMLALAREEMGKDPVASKPHVVLDFIVQTTDYRRRRLEGFDPSEAEVVAEFKKAWSSLDSYQAMTSPGVDWTWIEGRHATRFWMDELSRAPEGGQECLQLIGRDWQRWWDQTIEKQQQVQAPDDLLVKPQYLRAFYILGPNYFDQLTYRWVKYPLTPVDQGHLQWAMTSLERLPESVNWVLEGIEGAGFPSYVVDSGGLLPELMGRCLLVAARMSKFSTEERLGWLEESVKFARASAQPVSLADHLISAGREFKGLGVTQRAIDCWLETLELTDKIPLAQPAFEARFLLARELYEAGDYERAGRYAEEALQQIEEISPLIGVRSVEAQRWSQELSSIATLAARAHIAADSPERALASLTRAQQLQAAALEVEGRPGVKRDADQVRHQQQQVAAVTEQVKRLEAQPASPLRDEFLEQSRKLLAESKADYLTKSRELRQKHAALYSQALKFDPLDLPALQKELPADVAVLQFFPTEDTLYTFLVTKESFRLRSVAIADKDLDRLVVDFLRGVRRNLANDPRIAAQSRQLYDALLAPSVADLEGKTSLVLIPTGRLHGLPFACLTDAQGRTVVETWRLLELAKPTDLQRLSQQSGVSVESVVAFANATGDLPAAAAEGKKVAAMFPQSKLFESKEATRDNFFGFGGKAQVLHLATHGEWNLDDSLKNYLALAGSERIAQEEIFQLGLDETSLVILSACNTAMGEGGAGGYVASLAEAFWLAGSRSVVASLWAVHDGSTSLLMETFYQRLRAGDDKAEALRAAQLAVRAKEGFEHPYYWAGFVLFGERN